MSENLKKIIKLFVPEIILIVKRRLFKPKVPEKLFRGNSKLFKNIFSLKSIYGEYGCGESTLYVSKNFDIPVYSVESSLHWCNEIMSKSKKNLEINYVNIGNVDRWGRPDDYSLRDNFIKYAEDIWNRELKPNVILIDGRLRVLCFLVSLKKCNPGTKIIFDDYVKRKFYHVVEELIKPSSCDERQCLFEVNDKKNLNINKIDFLIKKFNYILD